MLQYVVLVGITAVIPVGAPAASSVAFPPRAASVGYSLISTSTPPTPPAIPLAPNDRGYVRVESKSTGQLGCVAESVRRSLMQRPGLKSNVETICFTTALSTTNRDPAVHV
jgi:hypothetical protein